MLVDGIDESVFELVNRERHSGLHDGLVHSGSDLDSFGEQTLLLPLGLFRELSSQTLQLACESASAYFGIGVIPVLAYVFRHLFEEGSGLSLSDFPAIFDCLYSVECFSLERAFWVFDDSYGTQLDSRLCGLASEKRSLFFV